MQSSLYALWLPAVVGDQECVFLSTVVSTLVVKILALILAVGLALSGHQQSVFRHPMVLWCEREEDWEPESLAGNITLCSFDSSSTHLTSCFNSSMSGVQKLRVCGSEEDEFILRISVLVTVIVSSCLSLGAALWLNKIIDYVELFKATKTLLCFATNPVVHRSALFSMVNSDKETDLETLTEMTGIKIAKAVINRPNRKGETVFQLACSNNDEWKAILLWTAVANLICGYQSNSETLAKNTFMHPLGIQHVVECSALVDLLDSWNAATNEEKEEVTMFHARRSKSLVFAESPRHQKFSKGFHQRRSRSRSLLRKESDFSDDDEAAESKEAWLRSKDRRERRRSLGKRKFMKNFAVKMQVKRGIRIIRKWHAWTLVCKKGLKLLAHFSNNK